MRLKCIANYRNDARGLVYLAGDEFDADEKLGQLLLNDAPGCFEEIKPKPPQAKRTRKPPANKAVKNAPEDK